MMSPASGKTSTKRHHKIFAPSGALLLIMVTMAQISAANMSKPIKPVNIFSPPCDVGYEQPRQKLMYFHFGKMNGDVVLVILVILNREKNADGYQDSQNDVINFRLAFLIIAFFHGFPISLQDKFHV